MFRAKRLLPLTVALAACGGEDPAPEEGPFIEGFSPAVREGYTRYIVPPVRDLAPGSDQMFCQWLTPPAEEDIDILELLGDQSLGGHHAILYATSIISPVGTSRDCHDADLTGVRYLGAIGGEGVSGEQGRLPEGVVYRLPKGFALMANTHYTNYKTTPIDGQAVLDIKTAAPDPNRKVASLFVNIDVEIELPKGQNTLDVQCEVQEELKVFWFGNHMHALGSKAKTQVTRANGGAVEVIREDSTWNPESAFNPQFNRWPLEAPLMLYPGDRIHTHCEWNNTGEQTVRFPTEMCAGFAFYVGSGVQFNCIKGEWGI